MRKIIFILCSLFLITLPIFSQAQRKANKDTEHWRYELQPAVGQAPHGCAWYAFGPIRRMQM